MRRLTSCAVVASLAMAGIGCGMAAPVVPPPGLLYTNSVAPASVVATGNDLGTKRGEASVETFFGLISVGDGSAKAAAANGRIRQLKHLDYEYFNVLGVYQRYTTVAYGD